MKIPAKVQRIVRNAAGWPSTETLSSAGGDLHWSGALKEAHVFPDLADAEAAQKQHGGFVVVVTIPKRTPRPEPEIPAEEAPEVPPKKSRAEMSIPERIAENRRQRRQRPTLDPAEVYERMEKRHEA